MTSSLFPSSKEKRRLRYYAKLSNEKLIAAYEKGRLTDDDLRQLGKQLTTWCSKCKFIRSNKSTGPCSWCS